MPLVKGTVAVSASGAVTGTGLARDLYDAEVGSYSGLASESTSQAIIAKQTIAAKALALADVIDAYVKSATITVPGVTAGGASVVGIVS